MEDNNKKTKIPTQEIWLLINKYFKYLIIFIVLIILICGYFLIIKPKYERTVDMIKISFEEQKGRFLKQKKLLDDIEAKILEFENLDEGTKNTLNAILPTEYPKEILFSEMEQLTAMNGFILTDLSVSEKGDLAGSASKNRMASAVNEDKGPDINEARIGVIKINMSIEGLDYVGLKRLLNKIESSLRLLDIQSLDYNPTSGDVNLEIYTYYLKTS